nr:intercellular adhesion molecule 1-like isoform X3 [Chrysemys picta bellii]
MAQPVPVLLWAWGTLTALAGAAQGSFEVSVSPEAAVVEHGGSVWINCSTTCRDPGASGGLETSLIKTDRKNGSSWVAFRLLNIKEWASSPQCYFTCNGNIKLVTANISAYRAPERVVLEPLPEMELGQAYNVMCRVLNVAPVTHLTVTLRRGGETLHTETFQNHTGTGPDDITVITEITPQRSDHGQEITCHTALDLHGSHFENSSSAVELKVYDLPEEPWLQTSQYIEVGATALARCRVAGVFPVAGEARFILSFEGENLNFTVTTLGDTATAQGEVRSPSPGQHQLNCTVSVGPVSRSAGQSVLVYRLPEPVLEVTESRTLVNSSVTVTCRSPEADPPGVLLQLRDAERVLVSSPPAQPLVQLHLTAGEEDNEREFTCEARHNSSIPAMKRTSARLTVLYGPRMDDSGCPREWIWKEGTEETFSCLARGNPAPTVVCTKDGVSASIGVQRQVRREDAGTYHCKASNAHGSASRDVTVQVEYLPEEPWLQTSNYIEVGTRALARCRVAGVFPVAGEARFNLSFGGESLNFTVTTSGDTATAQGEVRSPSPGQHQLNCTVSVGPVSRSAGQSVLVYRLPEPVLEVTESRTLVNSSVTVTCRSPEADPPGVLLQLRDAERVLVSSPPAQPLVQLHLMAGEEDDGREFTCKARPDSGIPAVKCTSARLTVLYGPRMNDSGCPREWIWKEGTEQTFSCLAQGNPAPAVECMKDGVPVSIGVQRQVRREDAGTYHCKASNAHGSASRDVTVQVEYLNIVVLTLGLVGAAAVLTGLGVGGYMYYRSTRI